MPEREPEHRVAWVSFDVIGRSCLEAAARAGAEVPLMITLPGEPDPGNRSGQCSFDAVADEVGARLVTNSNINAPEVLVAIAAAGVDMLFVVGWSQLLKEPLLSLAPGGVFGMHPTLLPKHRGRAPIPWAILGGLTTTGVTLFEIVDATADSGPIVGQVDVGIDPHETATTLYDKIHEAHVRLIERCVPEILAGRAPRIEQDERRASSWLKRTPADGLIDWDTRASYLYDWVRAQTRPYPGAFTFLGEEKLVVWAARPVDLEERAPVGTVVAHRDDGVVAACGEGGLLIEEAELGGTGPLARDAIARSLAVGARLG